MGAETPFQTEGWTEFTIGVMVILLRLYARWKAVGFKGWKGDDYFSLIALVLWTMDITVITFVGRYGTNIGVTSKDLETMSADDIAQRRLGSIWLFTGWNTYAALIWTLKGCMLCFFDRITLGLHQQKLVKWTAVACVATYIIMLTVMFTQCVPVQDNWQVSPIPSAACSIKRANYIAIAVLNITTDVAIVAIPIPLLFAVKLSVGRKLAIGALLCSGVFVMIATLLRCVLSLQNIEAINVCTIWAIRETFVAIIAVNAAPIKPLFSSKKWLKSSSKGGSYSAWPKGTGTYALSGKSKGSQIRSALPFHAAKLSKPAAGTTAFSSSEENMVKGGGDGGGHELSKTSDFHNVSIHTQDLRHNRQSEPGIVVTTTYQVRDADEDLEMQDRIW